MTDTIASTKMALISAARPQPISQPVISGLTAIYDAVVILGSSALAYALWLIHAPDVTWSEYSVVPLLGTVVALNVFQMTGVYRFHSLIDTIDGLKRVTLGWSVVATTLIAIGFLAKSSDAYSRGWSTLWFFLAWLGLATGRLVLSARSRTWIEEGRLIRNVVVVGTGPIARRLLEYLAASPDAGVRVLGIFDDDFSQGAVPAPKHYGGRPMLGDLDALVRFSRAQQIDTAIIALPQTDEERLLSIIGRLKTLPVDVRLCSGLLGFHLDRPGVSYIGRLPLINVANKPLSDWQSVAKDLEDRIAAAIILAMISPILLAIAALIKIDSPGPVFFHQKRYGFNNQLIDVFKFRTMYHESRDDNAEQLTQRNDPRITRLGAFLRKYSLDELPQFFNVLRGEMSIVGPRPHALSAKAAGRLYDEAVRDYAARHRVKPGITGWAQVNGWRGETETLEQIRKRVEHDLVYIENWSLWLDVKIIWMTIFGGFTGRNAF